MATRPATAPETMPSSEGLPSKLHSANSQASVAAAVATKTPCRFGRVFGNDRALTPPFCAVKVNGALFHTQGGLAVDEHARVLRADGSAFPNLFAGGGAARGVSGSGSAGYIAGNGLLTAIVLGRIAGARAALDVRETLLHSG